MDVRILLMLRAIAAQNVESIGADATRFCYTKLHASIALGKGELKLHFEKSGKDSWSDRWACTVTTKTQTVRHDDCESPFAALDACRLAIASNSAREIVEEILLAYNRHEDAASSPTPGDHE
jgi:hypothetical protein